MQFETSEGPQNCRIASLVIAGWTGRDEAGVQHHIKELAEIGVPAPSTTPLFYRVGANLLCQPTRIEVLGRETSGEAEPFLVRAGGVLWLGLGSDHTDRALEAVSVAASKQACPKPVASTLWKWDEISDLADSLMLSSEIHEDGEWVPYQTGTLAEIRPLAELVAGAEMADNSAMMCGTLPAIGGVRAASKFRATLEDSETNRVITLTYQTNVLPIVA